MAVSRNGDVSDIIIKSLISCITSRAKCIADRQWEITISC